MPLFLIVVFGFIFIFTGKKLFGKVINPLSLYSIVWTVVLFNYELKLIAYKDLSATTWVVIIFAQIAVFLGVLTVFSARKYYGKNNYIFNEKKSINYIIFQDNGKTIKYFIFFFSVIGLLAAIQHWFVLINEFGSIPAVFLKMAKIYRMRVEGEIKGVIPYIFISTFIAIFLSGLFAGYYNKFKLFMIFPFIALILKSLAEVARASLLFGILLFFITFILMRHLKSIQLNDETRKNNKKIMISLAVITIFIVLTAGIVKTFRSPAENYKASTRQLRQLEDGFLVSPAVYLYASAHIGVLNAYLSSQDEHTMFGENMFLPVYRFLAKFKFVPQPSYYQKGYFVPMWTNTGTYLRELHADYGPFGLFLFPYLLGIISTFYWFRFYEKHKLKDFVILVFIMLFIMFTFLVLLTRLGYWFISLFSIIAFIPVLEKIANFFFERSSINKVYLEPNINE